MAAPVEKQAIKNFAKQIWVKTSFYVLWKHIIINVENPESPNRQVRVIKFQNADDSWIKVVSIKISREAVFLGNHHIKARFYQI